MVSIPEKISLYFHGEKGQIGEVQIDAFVRESHEHKAKVAEHPVESGASFVDYVHIEPAKISLEGIVSNTPLSLLGVKLIKSAGKFLSGKSNDTAQTAYEALEKLFSQGEPLTISTSLKDYSNMVLDSLSVDRTANFSASLHFKASATQIRIVEQRLISIAEPKTKTKRTKKPKVEVEVESKAAPEKAKQLKSWLSALFW